MNNKTKSEQRAKDCAKAIEQVLGVTMDEMRGCARDRNVFFARVIFANFCMTQTLVTTTEIEATLNKTRKMAIYYRQYHAWNYEYYPDFKSLADRVMVAVADMEREAFQQSKDKRPDR